MAQQHLKYGKCGSILMWGTTTCPRCGSHRIITVSDSPLKPESEGILRKLSKRFLSKSASIPTHRQIDEPTGKPSSLPVETDKHFKPSPSERQFTSNSATAKETSLFVTRLNDYLKGISSFGEPYSSFIKKYFSNEIISMLDTAATDKMALTQADLKEHSFCITNTPISYWICTLALSNKDAKNWFGRAYGGYSKLLEKAWNSDYFRVPKCKVLVHIVYGRTGATGWVNITIFPVGSQEFGIKPILPNDLLTEAEKPLEKQDVHTSMHNVLSSDFEQLVAELINIGKSTCQDVGHYRTVLSYFWLPGPDAKKNPRVVEIGKRLYHLGNNRVELMQRAAERVSQSIEPGAVSDLSFHWHEIGIEEWRQGKGECWMA